MDNHFLKRREKLAEKLPENCAALLFSGEELPLGVDMMYPFSGDKSFYYLTGIDTPNAALLISRHDTKLMLPPFDPKREIYEGPQPTPEDICRRGGFLPEEWAAYSSVEDAAAAAIAQKPDCLYLDIQRKPVPCYSAPSCRARAVAEKAGIRVGNVYGMIYALRSVKDEQEINSIRKAVEITGESLTYMVQNCHSGMREYEWQAAFEYNLRRQGCSTSFPSIVASGKNAVYLHYEKNNAIVQEGELFLFDVGAYYNHYSSDISRTYPVGGKFTARQREIYELVYDATRLVLEYMKPYRPYGDHVKALQDFFGKYIIPMHIVDTEPEKERFLYMLSRGCCHHLGLEAHDAYAANDDILLPGMVFTNEPGVYLRKEGIGVRIEEDLLITESGNELLSENIPSAPDDILNLLR